MWAALWTVIKAIAAYLSYRFDPVQIARRDKIHKRAAEELGHEEIDKILSKHDTLTLSLFISEFLRYKGTDITPEWTRDYADRIIPQQRDTKDRDSDTTPGFGDE